jgi:hypothetical protein
MSFNDFNVEMMDSKVRYEALGDVNRNIDKPKKQVNCEKIITITRKTLIVIFGFLYYSFAIKALIDTNYIKERDICKTSDLWSYIFISLLTNFIIIKLKTKINENKLIIILLPNIYIIAIKIWYIIWASLLFYGISCIDKLSDTLLSKISILQYIFDIISLGITSICSLYIVYLVKQDNKETRDSAITALSEALGESRKMDSVDI